jgi:pimeloyl-ACP methyl ester carboxylesterase
MKKKFLVVVLAIIFLAFTYPIIGPSHILSKQFVIEQLKQPSSKFFNWNGLDIHYTDEGNGIPLVMVHGFTGSHRNFQKLTEMMQNKHRIIRVDLPGFGLSDFPEKDEDFLKMYQNFMADFVAHLNLKEYYLIGNSMGGGICCMHAEKHPEGMKGFVSPPKIRTG